jgi:hypothetical protein
MKDKDGVDLEKEKDLSYKDKLYLSNDKHYSLKDHREACKFNTDKRRETYSDWKSKNGY